MDAKTQIEFGNLHPLDATVGDSTDWAHSAARGVAAMMQDMPDMAAMLDAMDNQMKADFVSSMADIIREAQAADEASPAEAELATDASA